MKKKLRKAFNRQKQEITALVATNNMLTGVIVRCKAEIHATAKISEVNEQALVSCENANSEWKDKYKYATEFTQDILGL